MSRSTSWLRLLPTIFLIVAIGAVAYFFRGQLTLDAFVAYEDRLLSVKSQWPLLLGLGFVVYYALHTGMMMPGAGLLSLVAGKLFGLALGLPMANVAATMGATLAFLMSRFVFGAFVRERYGDRLAEVDRALEREGPFYLFSMRLIPWMPFFLTNILMGLTPIRLRTYWWVSQLSMLPGGVLYVYTGSQLPSLRELSEEGLRSVLTPGLAVAFIGIAVFPHVARFILSQFKSTES